MKFANVLGLQGIELMLASSREGLLWVDVMLASGVRATHPETSGCALLASDLASLLNDDRVLGIAELMNYPGLLAADPQVLEKVRLGRGKRIDGHARG